MEIISDLNDMANCPLWFHCIPICSSTLTKIGAIGTVTNVLFLCFHVFMSKIILILHISFICVDDNVFNIL